VKPSRLLRPFASLEEYFAAVRTLVADLSASGHAEASAALREGFGSLNGLTDGWALFLEAVRAAGDRYGAELTREQRRHLDEVRRVAHRITYRR